MPKVRRILVTEAMQILGVSKARIHQLIGAGRIKVLDHEHLAGSGRHWVSHHDVQKVLALRLEREAVKAAKTNGHESVGK